MLYHEIMSDPQKQPDPKNQPLRANIQCSFVVENEEQAREIYEQIGIFVKAIQPTSIVGGQVMKMFGPCCGQKGQNANPTRTH